MPDSIKLLATRRFRPFFLTQLLGAFNDNLYRNGPDPKTRGKAAYNLALAAVLADAEGNLGVNIIAFDVAALFAELVADPGSYGFADASNRCWTGTALGFAGGGTLCADPDSYVFFDGVHPTAAAHAILGDLATELVNSSVVPVPAALPLLLSGLGFLGVYGRRRKV